jgi:hypothetical protein
MRSLLLSVLLLIGACATTRATEGQGAGKDIAADAVVTTWIHIVGCPSGAFELFIFFADHGKTKVAHFTERDNLDPTVFKTLLGNVLGYQRQFDCGTGA